MAIDPQYGELGDFIANNPSRLANLNSVTQSNQLKNQAQWLANQQAMQQQAFAGAVSQATGNYLNSIGPNGATSIGAAPTPVDVKPTPVAGSTLPNPLGQFSVTLPPAAPPDSASMGDANVQASRAAMQSRPVPPGSIRTPEGFVIAADSPAAAQYGQQPTAADDSQPQPMGSVTEPPADSQPAQPSGEAPAPIAAAAAQAPTAPASQAVAQTPFQAEAARQAALPQNVAAQARQQAIQALVDDPSTMTRHIGAQLLNDPSVNPAQALQWIQARQTQDADLKKKIADSSTAANKASAERLSQADAQLRAWYDGSQTEQQRAQKWPQQTAAMVRNGLLTQEEADHFPQYPGDGQFPTALAYLAHSHELTTQVLKDKVEQENQKKLARENGSSIVTTQLAPYLAGRFKVGESAPNADIAEATKAYNTANEKRTEREGTETAQRETQVKADIAQALSKDAKDLTPAEVNQGRRIFSPPTTPSGEVAAADARSFVASNHRLPTDAEYSKIVQDATTKTRPLNINNMPENKDDLEANADMIANYQADPPSIIRKGSPAEAIMARVHALDPNYSKIKYEAFKNTEKSATSGKLAEAAKSIRTMTGHMEALSEAANALPSNNLIVMNRIANEFGLQTGKDPKTVYQTIVNRLAPEIEKAYVPEGGTAAERGIHASDFDAKLSPTQIQNNIRTATHLAGSLVDSLQHQYREGTYGRGNVDLLDDQSRQFYDKAGVKFQEKTVPVSKVDQFAAEHNIDERAAKKYFRGHGYMVYE